MKFLRYLLITAIFFPATSFAALEIGKCAVDGYTIVTINGVLTDDDGARGNMIALKDKVGIFHNGHEIDYEYLLNPSHLGGLGDVFTSIYQKAFENETVVDYDLVEMLNSASKKIKTQKLLLVAHSQGNFYANSFYDVVADKAGGIPAQSIGVYGVASPASRIAGKNSKWLTSKTDKVIATVVGDVPFKSIMPPNVNIALQPGDDYWGHDFEKVYIHYQSNKIIEDIKASLEGLANNTVQSENAPCISPPKITIAHQIAKADLAYLDTVVSLDKKAVVGIATTGATVAAGTYHVAVNTVVWTYHTTVAVATWTYHTAVATAQWTYNTAIAVGNSVIDTTNAVASAAYSAFTGTLMSGSFASNNMAAVILATQPAQMPSLVSVNNNQTTVTAVPVAQPQTSPVTTPSPSPTPSQPQTVFVFSPKVQNRVSAPKLVFVGSFGGGGAPTQTAPQILGAQTTVFVVDEATTTGDVIGGTGATMVAPVLSAPQCTQTLATDGCLLATTTIHFEWPSVSDASYYLINKNGEYATTTDTSLDITAQDFSNYTLDVVAIGADGQSSATSTQAVSVATIPIAINEIAWMGTVASANDEWFEIKNNTAHTIDLSQWELNAKDGTPHVKLTGTIAPRAYLVFERTDNTTITDINAHQIYTGALGNAGEQLNLSYASTTFDQTPDGAWPAGENSTTTKKTMERYSSREPGADASNWGTNLGYIKNGTDANGNAIDGTPGVQNSVSTLINKGQNITSDLTLTNAEEQYVIANALRVSASSTLTIGPGVAIKFYEENWWQPARLDVYGALSVQGTQENPVTFASFTDTPAGSVELHGTATSTITSANFDTTYEGVNTYGGTTEITDSSFSNVENESVGAYSGAQVSLASSTITNTLRGDAIGVYDGAVMTIASTTIDGVQSGDGIFAYNATVNIASSTIKNISDSGLALSGATSTISNVAIENAGWSGIDVYRGTSTIASTTVSGVDGYAGISVDSPSAPVTITGGEVTGNTLVGVSMAEGSAILNDVSVHDNGTSSADNVVVW